MAKAQKAISAREVTRNVPRDLVVPALTDDAYTILAAFREFMDAEAALWARFEKEERARKRKLAIGGKASRRERGNQWVEVNAVRNAYNEKVCQIVERITHDGDVVKRPGDILTLALIDLLGHTHNAGARGPLILSLLGAAGVQITYGKRETDYVILPKRNAKH